MDKTDILTLNSILQGLYGERFPGLTPKMAAGWLEDLHSFSAHILARAVHQWARRNTFRPPGVEDLRALAVEVTDEEDEQRRRLQAHARQATAGQGMDEALALAAAHAGPADTTRWAHLHITLFRTGAAAPGHYADAAALCEQYACQYPEDARAWQAEALWWRQGALGPLSFGREPGEEG